MTNTARPAHAARPELSAVLGDRVVVADGAMGTMLQASDAALEDFDGHEGCNEILNVTRPDIVRAVHDGYLEAGVDCVTTNTFGANLSNLGEYGMSGPPGRAPSCRPSATPGSPTCATPISWARPG